jgi:hypothetical protein
VAPPALVPVSPPPFAPQILPAVPLRSPVGLSQASTGCVASCETQLSTCRHACVDCQPNPPRWWCHAARPQLQSALHYSTARLQAKLQQMTERSQGSEAWTALGRPLTTPKRPLGRSSKNVTGDRLFPT